jgi:hypothetical protein
MKILDVPGDGERLPAASALPRLEHAEGIREPACDRRRLAGGRRTAVEDDDGRPGLAVDADVDSTTRPIRSIFRNRFTSAPR